MRKLTVYIEGSKKTVSLSRSIILTDGSPSILVKKATIFWDYNNVFAGINSEVKYGGASISLPDGYYTYQALKHELGLNTDISLEAYRASGKCSVIGPSGDLEMGKLGELLGFSSDLVIKTNQRSYSLRQVDVNKGLRYVEISCSIVDKSMNTNTDGIQSGVVSSLPLPSNTGLKGSVTRYNDIESRVAVSKGSYNEITFEVSGNNGVNGIGSVLLELYIG